MVRANSQANCLDRSCIDYIEFLVNMALFEWKFWFMRARLSEKVSKKL